MVRSTRLPVALLALAGAIVVAGLVAYGNTQHLSCDDTEDPVMSFVYLARWAGLTVALLSLLAAWIASRRARGRRPSWPFTTLCVVAAVAGLVACAAPHSAPVAPVGVVLVLATLAVIVYFLPALAILALTVGVTRVSLRRADEPRRRLRMTQAVALWSAFVLAPGCAGAGLVTQYPVCLG